VLIHGIGMGRKVFGDLTHRLAERGRVIAIDLPGYGEAPEPPRTPTMERLGDLVAAFIRSESLVDPVIIGHSMGTQVAVAAVTRHPELTDRVVLVAPTVNDRERRAVTQLLRLGQDLLIESPKVLVLGGREYIRAGPNLRSKMRAMLAHRPEDAYPHVAARVLVLRGEDDLVVPHDWCERIVAALPDARLEEVEGHGHETMIRDAAPAAALILEWLSSAHEEAHDHGR
jgi:pimeloyl-ACP methyl ester carboxylesterase